jgi:uncharacterized protein YjbI with pentapeptide repeats
VLAGADLRQAQLYRVCLKNANLAGAKLKGAVLLNVNLSGADLRGTELDGAFFAEFAYDHQTRWPAGFELSSPHFSQRCPGDSRIAIS